MTCNFVSPSHSISGDENSPLAYIYVSHTPWSLIFQFIVAPTVAAVCLIFVLFISQNLPGYSSLFVVYLAL